MLEHLQDISPDFLTASEAAEITRITSDVDVIAYAVLDMDGREVASGGAWSDMLAPVFANALDLGNRMGDELGENDGCNMFFVDGPAFETISIMLSATAAVFLKRKPKKDVRGGLRSVG